MATLTKQFPGWLRAILRGLRSVLAPAVPEVLNIGASIYTMIWVAVLGAITTSLLAIVGYLVFSGEVLQALARVMAWACVQTGSCSDFPAMLTGLAVGIYMLLLVFWLMLGIPLTQHPDQAEPDAYDVGLVALLLHWYRIGPRERGALLEALGGTELELSERVMRWLQREHHELEALDGDH